MNHSTCCGSSWSKKADSFMSKFVIFSISSDESSKSKISIFSAIRSGRTDLAKATIPLWINHRRTTCPIDFPYCLPISANIGLVNRSWRPSANGAHASTWTPYFSCHSWSSIRWFYGFTSIWLIWGVTSFKPTNSIIFEDLKFEIPIARNLPDFWPATNARQAPYISPYGWWIK